MMCAGLLYMLDGGGSHPLSSSSSTDDGSRCRVTKYIVLARHGLIMSKVKRFHIYMRKDEGEITHLLVQVGHEEHCASGRLSL